MTTQDLINKLRQGAPVTARQVKAMEAQAELNALKAAVMPVVDWYVLSKREFPTDFTSNSVVLLYGGRNGVEKVTGAQFNALAKLVLEDK